MKKTKGLIPKTVNTKTFLATILTLTIVIAFTLNYALSASTVTIVPASFVETASYTIWKDGSTYYAKNGMTGAVDYSGTDAATVIQAAMDALPDGRGKIFMKQGDYTFTSAVTVPAYCWIIGEGYTTTQIWGAIDTNIFNVNIGGSIVWGGGIEKMTLRPEGTCTAINVYGIWHYVVRDVVISRQVASGGYNIGINLNTTFEAHIENNGIAKFNETGIKVNSNANGVVIFNNEISALNATAIHVVSGVESTKIVANWIEYGAGDGGTAIKIEGTQCDVTSNKIHAGYLSTSYGVNVTGDENVFSGNTIYCSDGYTVYINGSDNTFTGNLIRGGTAIDYVIYLAGGKLNTITGNTITALGGYAIYNPASASYKTTISGNTIYCNGTRTIQLESTNQIITGNFIEIGTGCGWVVRLTAASIFIGNTIDAESIVAGQNGVVVYGDSTIISNNKFRNLPLAIDFSVSAPNSVCTSNVIVSCTIAIGTPSNGGIIKYNVGFVTENSGTAEFADNSTTTFNHGLADTPTFVSCSFNDTATGAYKWTATATEITVTVAVSGNYTVYWMATYKP